MKRYAAMLVLALVLVGVPCQAQFLKQLENSLLGGQQPGQQQGMTSLVGNVNLPPGQYMMTNVQTGQAFYVVVQNGQMFLTGQPVQQQMMVPGPGMMQQQQQQQGGMGGLLNGGLGNFLKNGLAPQQGAGQ